MGAGDDQCSNEGRSREEGRKGEQRRDGESQQLPENFLEKVKVAGEKMKREEKGVKVKSGEPYPVEPGEGRIVHLSLASLGEVKKDKGNESIYLYVTVDGKKLALGTLSPEKLTQQQFYLVFDKNFELSHDWKNGSIYFYGYRCDIPFDESEDGEIVKTQCASVLTSIFCYCTHFLFLEADYEEDLPVNAAANAAAKQKVKTVEAKTDVETVEAEDDSSDEEHFIDSPSGASDLYEKVRLRTMTPIERLQRRLNQATSDLQDLLLKHLVLIRRRNWLLLKRLMPRKAVSMWLRLTLQNKLEKLLVISQSSRLQNPLDHIVASLVASHLIQKMLCNLIQRSNTVLESKCI